MAEIGQKRGISISSKMKIRRISGYQCRLSFDSLEQTYQAHWVAFLQSDLGKIYQAIPWQELINLLGLKDHAKGPESLFSPRGKLALMFLKHYAACSDQKLMQQLNANIDYQLFCDIYIPPSDRLTNYKIISEIRCDIASRLDIDQFQQLLADHWRPFMANLDSVTYDATCYESAIRYPTDVKLLWESVHWSYRQLKQLSKQAGVKLLRTKYRKWKRRYQQYSKLRRKTSKRKRALLRALLALLAKISAQLTHLEHLPSPHHLVRTYHQRRKAIEQVLAQQHAKFHDGQKPSERIVSIDKPYIRPIVRGKEIKGVEFGAKVHKLQVDGISFIEHLSFDAFHEGNRLALSIIKTQQLTHTRVRLLGADGIYATNANRKMITKAGIGTDFKAKGRPGKFAKQKTTLAKAITKERASRLEGSFGTDKEHFLLKRIMARTKRTEILWIFMGIHTSNALKIGRRMAQQKQMAA